MILFLTVKWYKTEWISGSNQNVSTWVCKLPSNRTDAMSSLGFLPAAKPPRSMDHKITVGGERGGWVLICLLAKLCEMRGRIGVTLPPWKILRIVFKCEVKSAMLPFVAHIYCPCRRRSIGPLSSCYLLMIKLWNIQAAYRGRVGEGVREAECEVRRVRRRVHVRGERGTHVARPGPLGGQESLAATRGRQGGRGFLQLVILVQCYSSRGFLPFSRLVIEFQPSNKNRIQFCLTNGKDKCL